MKREILFRGKVSGKRLNKGEWIEGDLVHQLDYYVKPCDKYFILNKYDTNDYEIGEPIQVDPATVGQFTGLTDKNGVKIFEGDKLYCEARLDKAEMYVVFEEGQFRMVLCDKFKEYETGRGYYDINCFQKTVIGNIHDTPDLAKEESE